MKKNKNQKIEQEQSQAQKVEKKPKSKKKRRQQTGESQKTQQTKINPSRQIIKSNLIKEEKEQCKIPETTTPQNNQVDYIALELSKLQFDGLLSPNIENCKSINQRLQELTIHSYEMMIMKTTLISEAIKIARKSKLTPKDYFSINYTNKIILIRNRLAQISAKKYAKFIKMIDTETDRVEKMILRSLNDMKLFDEVFLDLKRNNVEWQINDQVIDQSKL